MQKYIVILLIIVSQISQLTAQRIEISPENPGPNDCIYIYTEAITSNLAFPSRSNIIEEGNNFNIETCYLEGSANAIGYYYDTIALGYRQEGEYHINYLLTIARQGTSSCDDGEQILTQLSFEVEENSSSEIPCNELEVNIYPNPITDSDLLRITASESISRIDVFDALGKFIYGRGHSGNDFLSDSYRLFPIPGIYFVRINGRSENSVTVKMIKF